MAGLSTLDLAVIVIGVLLLFFWVFLYIKGKKNADLFLGLDSSDYPGKDFYFIGFALCELLKLDFQKEENTADRKMLSVLYGTEYVDYYIRAIFSQRISMMLTIACFAMPIYCLSGGSILLFIAIIAVGIFAYFYYGRTLPDKVEQRKMEMLSDFSEVVSKLALLVNAGMILHDAWRRVSESGSGEIYKEMQQSVREMQNGKPEVEAIFGFGQRCMLPEVKKFSTTLIQSAQKGSSELSFMLKQQSKEVWTTKQQLVKRQGELANDKLLIPIVIIFIGIIVMIIVPIFAGIGG